MKLTDIPTRYGERVYAKFDKKYYIHFDGVLRAAKLEKINFLTGTGKGWRYFRTFRVAGLGMIEEPVEDDGSVYHFTLYNSVADYTMKCESEDCTRYEYLDILANTFDGIATLKCDYSGYHSVVRWRWDGTEALPVPLSGNIFLDATHWYTDVGIPEGTYATKEECERDNQISVIEFDE